MSTFLLPPVVGEVSLHDVSIVAELGTVVRYVVYCEGQVSSTNVDGSEDVQDSVIVKSDIVSPSSAGERIVNVVITDLRPDTKYSIDWYDEDYIQGVLISNALDDFRDLSSLPKDNVKAHNVVKTLARNGPSRIVAVSGNAPTMQAGQDLWSDVIDVKPDIIVHIGDNVSMDNMYNQTRRTIEKKGKSQARNDVREVYRKDWTSNWNCKRSLMECSNIMIHGSHEFNSSFPKVIPTKEHESFAIAWEAYHLYQERLLLVPPPRRNVESFDYPDRCMTIEGNTNIDEIMTANRRIPTNGSGYARRWGDLVMIVSEWMSLERHGDFISQRWPHIMTTISRLNTRRVIIFLPKVLLPMSKGLLSKSTTDEIGKDDLLRIYNNLFDWLMGDSNDRKPDNVKRYCLLVFGGIHIGGHGKICNKVIGDKGSIDFVMSTPITDCPITNKKTTRKSLKSAQNKVPGYHIQYDNLVTKRNFAKIDIEDIGFTTQLVIGSGKKPSRRTLFDDVQSTSL